MSNTNKRNTSKKQEDTDEEQQLVNIDKPIELLQKWLKYDKPRNVLLSQMTKRGNYRLVTEEGKKTIEQQIIKMGGGNFDKGLDYSEPFLLQELPEEDKINKDKKPEYLILGGNHRFEVFQSHDIEEWPCLILKASLNGVTMTEEEREVLAGANNAKAQDGTAKAPWFEYLQKLIRYLEMPGVQTKTKGKKVTVNWARIHQLSGKRDGLVLDSAKKLYTVYNKLTNKGAEDIAQNAVYKKLKELHLKYGYKNPMKLSCITENKAFWKLDDMYKLAAIEEFVSWAIKNDNKASLTEFSGIVARQAHIVSMVDYVRQQAPNADLLEDYVEAIQAGTFEALETATANDLESAAMQAFIKDLNASVAVKSVKVKAVATTKTVPKSPTASKNTKGADKVLKERLPVDLPVPEKESRKRDRDPAAPADAEPPQKKSRTNKKDDNEGAVITAPGNDESESDVDEDVPFRKDLVANVEKHFDPHFRVVNSFSHIQLQLRADLIFLVLENAEQFRNSLLQPILKCMHLSSRLVVLADPSAAYSIFHSLSQPQNPLVFEFKYTACLSAPPVKSFTGINPVQTTWDFYFLRLRAGNAPCFNTNEGNWVKHGHYNPNWQHGVFKTPPAYEMLREKLSLTSTALFPRQPPVQVLWFIFSVYTPADGVILELNNLSGTGYIAAALSSRSYVGYITNGPLKNKIKAHVCRVLSRSVDDPQAALAVSTALAVSSLAAPEGTAQQPSTPAKAFLPDAFDEPLLPVTPSVRGTTPMPKFNNNNNVEEADVGDAEDGQMSPVRRFALTEEDD